MITARIDRAPRVGETGVITWIITSAWDAPEVRAKLELPAGVAVVSGDPSWNGALGANQQHINTTTITIVQPGVIDIRAVVQSGPQGGDSWSDVDHLYLTVSATEASVGLP
jgi:hypothetical protein